MSSTKTMVALALSVLLLVFPIFSDAGEKATLTEAYYTCPMHPEVHSIAAGECPICHMTLKKATGANKSQSSGERRIQYYRNPMNPSITSKTPMKDNMGMDYIPVYDSPEKVPSSGSASDIFAVPGRSAVSLDETQFRLSGVSLVQVIRGDLDSTVSVSGRALSASRVSIQVSERDLPHLKSGLEVELESPATGSLAFRGHITSLDSLLDPMTRSLRADVQIKTQVQGLRAEASVTGSIHIKRSDVLLIPDSSVLYLDQGTYVYVADRENGLLIPKRVRLGLQGQGKFEVLGGLITGDFISSGPNFLIDSESRIQSAHD